MKKIAFILFISLFLTTISFSQGMFVNENIAQTVAEKFYFERIQPHRAIAADNIKAVNSFIIQENDITLYYIFNISTGGFVAISAYNATTPVLCYSFSGKYEPADRPENYNAWMQQYNR